MNILEDLQELNVSEECLEDILSIVEEIISERNQENREKKKTWEINRGEYTKSPIDSLDSKKEALRKGERTIKSFQKYVNNNKDSKDYIVNQDVIDGVAKGNRIILGRHQNPVSFSQPGEFYKVHSKDSRAQQSRRGTTKDEYENNLGDRLKIVHSLVKSKLEGNGK